jgi:hypothetical protein
LDRAEDLLITTLNTLLQNKHSDAYTCYESLAGLYLKKSQLEQNDQQKFRGYKTQAQRYLEQALEVIKEFFPKESPHLTRLQAKMEEVK